ncbi:MAG: toxin-antitoxin system protein [Candidatus Cryptobacteroides sp.]|nr:toxin-antitoxin system protein [Bacteroidales bacterium]
MNTALANKEKTLTSFRLNTQLLERLRFLAKKSNRSLNNYVETLLLDVVYHEPNDETIEAIAEARSGKNMEAFDRRDLEKLISSL